MHLFDTYLKKNAIVKVALWIQQVLKSNLVTCFWTMTLTWSLKIETINPKGAGGARFMPLLVESAPVLCFRAKN